ncbi:MAG: nucleotidyl transferase AbiEii/AbiGii toxin family protein [Actinobacteria bacterium]|nr:nucleotidyl transferase AbiEii/AbiGii toxin family protein [Actinomycetota bacterium]
MASFRDPELDVAARALVDAGARFVVIGGFAVIANRFVRATEDVDLLVPDDPDNDRRVLAALRSLRAVRQRDEAPLADEHLIGREHLRVIGDAGMIDVIRDGVPPLDFETVASEALRADYDGLVFPVAGLRSIVAFKRLAGRPQDLRDLERLAEIHGSLPEGPIPGLDP